MTASPDFISLADASSAAASTNASSLTSSLSKSMSSEDFMTLFLAEMKNQNPLEPMSDTEMMSQMVQLDMLNEITALNTSLQDFAKSNQVTNASALIGKQVQATSPADGTRYDGIVKSLSISGSNVRLQLEDGSEISLDWLTGVEDASASSSTEA